MVHNDDSTPAEAEQPIHHNNSNNNITDNITEDESNGVGVPGGFGLGVTPRPSVSRRKSRRLSGIAEESGIRTPIDILTIKI